MTKKIITKLYNRTYTENIFKKKSLNHYEYQFKKKISFNKKNAIVQEKRIFKSKPKKTM